MTLNTAWKTHSLKFYHSSWAPRGFRWFRISSLNQPPTNTKASKEIILAMCIPCVHWLNSNELSLKAICRGWGDSSECTPFAMPASRFEFNPWNPHKKCWVRSYLLVIPELGRQKPTDLWCSLLSHSNLTGELQASKSSYVNRGGWHSWG